MQETTMQCLSIFDFTTFYRGPVSAAVQVQAIVVITMSNEVWSALLGTRFSWFFLVLVGIPILSIK